MELLFARESLAALSPSLFLAAEVHARLFGRLIAQFGPAGSTAGIFEDLQRGRVIGTLALCEGGMNIVNEPLKTEGTPESGNLRIQGFKDYVVNAPIADWFAVAGELDGDLAFFLINKANERLSIGKSQHPLGYQGVTMASIALDGACVPSDDLVGPFNGMQFLHTVRRWEDEILIAAALGIIKRCYESALDYAKQHKSGGKPIIAYQEIGFKLAEMLTLYQTAQLLAYRAAWMVKSGEKEMDLLIQCAKVFCCESAEEVASKAMQIRGAQGFVGSNPVEEGFRITKYLQIAGTSSEISRMNIGDGLLQAV
jgi:alkylation response protein AidB-like acyl-CoA dehydrogenase